MRRAASFLQSRLEQSARLLSGPGVPDDEAVHLARKRLKDARAALRLLRPVLGEPRALREERVLGRASRRLSATRDERVVADLLERLGATSRPSRKPASTAPDSRRSGREIEACRRRLAAAFPCGLPRAQARAGLRKTYRQARRRLRAARDSGRGDDRHALRKSVKRLRGQLDALRTGSEFRSALGRLGRLLGEERDMGLLLRFLAGRGRNRRDTAAAERARRRQARLSRRAIKEAQRLFRDPPTDFARRQRF